MVFGTGVLKDWVLGLSGLHHVWDSSWLVLPFIVPDIPDPPRSCMIRLLGLKTLDNRFCPLRPHHPGPCPEGGVGPTRVGLALR